MRDNIDLVIFGSQGDLAKRKLLPALYRLDKADLLPDNARIASVARHQISTNIYLSQVQENLQQVIPKKEWDNKVWTRFKRRIYYIKVDFSQKKQFNHVSDWMEENRKVIFYLATPPSLYESICKHMASTGCVSENTGIVLEKPIGHDLRSSKQVNDAVGQYFSEKNIFRIDHYLGKETVQNLLALRFANRIINSQWDNKCIDHIQITAAETVGIEGRWSYYDTVGQLRDMFQNHLLQLLCMVAMEPPNSLKAEEIRAEKIKLLRALRPIGSDKVDDYVVRGQYTNGWIDGKPVVGYLEEEGAENSNSNNETFVAIKVEIDNWRWAGVPFYMRTGKRLNAKHTEIIIAYKESSHSIIADKPLDSSNKLVIRLQPNEGIELEMISKKQSLKQRLSTEKRVLNLDFHDSDSDKRVVDAYERLFLELIKGDQWLFVSREEIETSWDWCDQIIDAWNKNKSPTRLYSAGSGGPAKAEVLIESDGRSWHGQ